MAAHAGLKNEFTEDENLMRWLNAETCSKTEKVSFYTVAGHEKAILWHKIKPGNIFQTTLFFVSSQKKNFYYNKTNFCVLHCEPDTGNKMKAKLSSGNIFMMRWFMGRSHTMQGNTTATSRYNANGR